MTAEEFREQVTSALEQAVVGDNDLDAIEAVLDDAKDRVDTVRVMRGETDG